MKKIVEWMLPIIFCSPFAFAEGSFGVGSTIIGIAPDIISEISLDGVENRQGTIVDSSDEEELMRVESISLDEVKSLEDIEVIFPRSLGQIPGWAWGDTTASFVENPDWFACNQKRECFAFYRRSESERVSEIIQGLKYK